MAGSCGRSPVCHRAEAFDSVTTIDQDVDNRLDATNPGAYTQRGPIAATSSPKATLWRCPMYVRRTLTKSAPDRLENARSIITDTVIPMVQGLPGYLGGYWLADPQSGEGMTITFFASEADLEATAPKANEIRASAAQQIGAEVLGVEHLEVIASTGDKVHRSASGVRVVDFESDPAKIEDAIKTFKELLIPGLGRIPGFEGGFWAVNRTTGKGFGVTLYDSPASAEASRTAATQLRERIREATGATIAQPHEYEVIARSLATARTPV